MLGNGDHIPSLSDACTVLLLYIVGECLAEGTPHCIVDRWIEVKSLVLALRRPTKTGLKSEAVYQIELTPHYYTCGRLSRFLYFKAAVVVIEVLVVFSVKPK